MSQRKGFVVVISGPSGAGKTSIAHGVLARISGASFSVSATTRAPRENEREGKDYFFIARAEFERRAAAGRFLEWAEYSGNLYGTPLDAVEAMLRQGQDVILDIETQGAASVRRVMPDAVLVFVLPPTYADLERRITGRSPMAPADLALRLQQARIELAMARNYDYVVVNRCLDQAVEEVKAVIMAQRCTLSRQREWLDEWLEGAELIGHSRTIPGSADD